MLSCPSCSDYSWFCAPPRRTLRHSPCLAHFLPFSAQSGLRLSDHRLEVVPQHCAVSSSWVFKRESGLDWGFRNAHSAQWLCHRQMGMYKASVFRTFYFCPHCVNTEKPFLLKLKRTGWESRCFPGGLMLYPQVTFRGNLPAWGERGTFASSQDLFMSPLLVQSQLSWVPLLPQPFVGSWAFHTSSRGATLGCLKWLNC